MNKRTSRVVVSVQTGNELGRPSAELEDACALADDGRVRAVSRTDGLWYPTTSERAPIVIIEAVSQ